MIRKREREEPIHSIATVHLQKELKELLGHPTAGFRVEPPENLFQWTVWIAGPQETPYHPGQYKALLSFPQEFPMRPPTLRFVSSFWHPNVYDNGTVCISILHEPGTDEHNSLESAGMRWLPIHSVRSVLISVISLLSDPDPAEAGAPANVEALSQYRRDRRGFVAKVAELAQKSLRELPADYTPPPLEDPKPVRKASELLYSPSFDNDEPAASEKEASHPWADELQRLRDMGVGADKTDDELLALLSKHKDVATVCEQLMEDS